MGWNSVILVLNDCLHEIETDPQFGAKVHREIADGFGRHECKRNYNAFGVVCQSHADDVQIVSVGRNTGRRIRPGDKITDMEAWQLRRILENNGYRVQKKRKKES